ncbi:MAG: hypothetical protein SXG53_27870 [Pseudomonadota bacterium]|nr:hypothetical protein [Pseudomonadota bacterium]
MCAVADVEISAPTAEMAKLAAEVRDELSRVPSAVTERIDLRVVIGAEAFRAALESDDGRPIVAAYLTSTEFEVALRSGRRPPHITAVFSNPDPLDQVALAELLLGRPAIGVFDSPVVQTLTSRLAGTGVRLMPAHSNRNIDALLRAAQGVDVILALPDGSVLNPSNINHVVRTLYQRRSVLIGYSSALTRVGSLASVYGSPRNIARSVASVVERYADDRALPEPAFVSEISVAFNSQLARSLNIALPGESATVRAIKMKREARGSAP